MLAYGQTGSGKTYSMGTGFEVGAEPENLGIIPRYHQHWAHTEWGTGGFFKKPPRLTLNAVLRIRDVYPGSRSRLFSIPDPNCLHLGSRILIKEFKYFNPKKAKKLFPSSKKYDPGCSSRIPDLDADFLSSQIPDPGVKKAPNPGSRIRIRNTALMTTYRMKLFSARSISLESNVPLSLALKYGTVRFYISGYEVSLYFYSGLIYYNSLSDEKCPFHVSMF